MTREQKENFVRNYCVGRPCDTCVINNDEFHRHGVCYESANDMELDHNVMLVANALGLEFCDTAEVEEGALIDDDLIIIKSPSGRKVDNIVINFKEEN